MKYHLVITADAQLEETEAYNYYEGIRPDLGEGLLAELKKSYHKIVNAPLYYSYLQTSTIVRCIKTDRFPFVVIYLVSGSDVIVLSVRTTSRQPYI